MNPAMLALAALTVLQTPLMKPVTFDEPAMPLARLLPALSRASGVEIVASNSVAHDVALVRVVAKPLVEVLKRLAEEDGAEVEETRKGYRIVRTASSERKEHEAALKGRMASLQPALEAARKGLLEPSDEVSYRLIALRLKAERERRPNKWLRPSLGSAGSQTPALRAVFRTALALPLAVLADLQEGDRIVYSNRPTRLQSSMPGLGAVLRAFASEQDAWAAAVAKIGPPEASNRSDDPFRHADPVASAPTRAVAILSRTNSASAAVVRLVILGSRNEELADASFGFQAAEMQKGMDTLMIPQKSGSIEVSPETQALIDGLPAMDDAVPRVPSPTATALVSHPEDHDPLSFGATDMLRHIAGDKPIIAVLPDRAWYMGLFRAGGPKRGDRALFDTEVASREQGGWVLAHPREPEIARRCRVDRNALGTFVRTIVAEKRVPLDAYARYAWAASNAPSDVVGVPLAMMLASGLSNPDVPWRELRLYGSLSPSDRKAMAAGGKKTWASLSLPQRALAEWIVEHHVNSVSGRATPSSSLSTEPTEVFASGFDDLVISLRTREDAPLLCDSTTRNSRNWRRVIDPRSAGAYLSMEDGPGFDRYGVAKRTTVRITLSAKEGVGSQAELEDVVPPSRPLVPLAELPEPVRLAVERARDEATKQKGDG